MTIKNLFLISLCTTLFLASCSDDDNTTPEEIIQGAFQNGILVSHEGSTTGVSGSVSFIPESLANVRNNIYSTVNEGILGTFQQSIGFLDSLAFVVVDNANTVAVVNRYTFKEKTIVTEGLQTPRYIDFAGGKGYVTNWGNPEDTTDDFIAVLDLETFTVENTIPVSNGPERVVGKGDFIYVSHKGGFTNNDILSIIDINTDNVTEVVVGDNPDELELDGDENLWILCGGKPDFVDASKSTPGALVKLNTTTNEIETTIPFPDQQQPSLMDYENGEIYYYLDAKVYKIAKTSQTLAESPILEDLSYYGMSIRDNRLYAVDAKDFGSDGELDIIDLETLEVIESVTVGVVPSKIYFQ
ncbi:YncE family protein [Aquimarina sp. ERC-38]|uniref:YncE family protein n=1 Tax=Aquimarina sp. ERC-38 TaxID=2949996 RepID=UPI002246D7C7|nr:YncE family protein [Aquimarina sp. ERC-38]UZO80772.1 YncE family protein [Aquimarina sp. ERC-38]